MSEPETFSGWVILEAMGHQRVAGFGTTPGGPGALAGTFRVDVHDGETVVTQYYGTASIYRLTPCDEVTARRISRPSLVPVHAYAPRISAGEDDLEGEHDDRHEPSGEFEDYADPPEWEDSDDLDVDDERDLSGEEPF